MAYDYVPNPPHTEKHKRPQPGQSSVYVDEDGNKTPCILTAVEALLPNGNYQVGAIRLRPSRSQLISDPSKLGGNPGENRTALERDGWQFNPEENEVYYCPCNPPDPSQHCPP